MINKISLMALSILLCCALGAKPHCHIYGRIDSVYNGYLSLSLTGAFHSDKYEVRIPVKDGRFSKDITLPYYGMYSVVKDSDQRSWSEVIIDTPQIYLYNEGKDGSHILCRGSAAMDAYAPLLLIADEQRAGAGRYVRASIKQPGDTAALKVISTDMGKVIAKMREAQLRFIKSFPDNVASAYELTKFNFDREADTIRAILGTLSDHVRSSPYGRRVLDKMATVDVLGIGNQVPAIHARDTTGKSHSLSEYRGKYILLDLWASWCGPCRMQLPYLRHVHDDFGGRVQIVSVSIDKDRDDWVKAINRDSLSWTNLCDPGGYEGKAARAMKLEGIPSIYLISPEGKILSKPLYGKSVYEAVRKELDGHQ